MVDLLRGGLAAVESPLNRPPPNPGTDRIEPLRQPQPVQLDQAPVGTQDAPEASQRRRFAGAVLAQQHEDISTFDLQVDSVHSPQVAKALAQAFDADHGIRGFLDTWLIRSFRMSPLERRRRYRLRPAAQPDVTGGIRPARLAEGPWAGIGSGPGSAPGRR